MASRTWLAFWAKVATVLATIWALIRIKAILARRAKRRLIERAKAKWGWKVRSQLPSSPALLCG